ncbi:hypothetical protein JTE90_021623 [Oedothorax gibbosus]|uniref:Uncharacterized protein n=1 Tax=Oedothorax gibbosus TaxID=931172 RepID=A0AAV6VRK0_9ARAC|nr:hypothetical protein JTE90_021623 [Oedothorax gibbosus]
MRSLAAGRKWFMGQPGALAAPQRPLQERPVTKLNQRAETNIAPKKRICPKLDAEWPARRYLTRRIGQIKDVGVCFNSTQPTHRYAAIFLEPLLLAMQKAEAVFIAHLQRGCGPHGRFSSMAEMSQPKARTCVPQNSSAMRLGTGDPLHTLRAMHHTCNSGSLQFDAALWHL